MGEGRGGGGRKTVGKARCGCTSQMSVSEECTYYIDADPTRCEREMQYKLRKTNRAQRLKEINYSGSTIANENISYQELSKSLIIKPQVLNYQHNDPFRFDVLYTNIGSLRSNSNNI